MAEFKMPFKLDDEFRQRNRPLTKQERIGLERLIEDEGCKDGALTVAIIGTEKVLCDGYNTLDICQEKGVAPAEPRFLAFKDREAVLEWIDRHQRSRRNLTAEEMAENKAERTERVVEAVVLEGKSIKNVAKEEGVSAKTIRNDIDDFTRGTPPPSSKDTNGKKPGHVLCRRCKLNKAMGRPLISDCEDCKTARNAPTPPPPETAPPDFDDPPEARLDANFVTVPEHVLPAFEVAGKIAKICHAMDAIGRELSAILEGKVGSRAISQTSAQRLADLRQHLWQSRASHICAYCQGAGEECMGCRGQGWQSAAQFAQAPKEMQDAMRKMGARNVPI